MVKGKEHLWPAGVAALAMHGLVIATLALGINYPQGIIQGTPKQDFCAEVVFALEIGYSPEKYDDQTRQIPDAKQAKNKKQAKQQPLKDTSSQKTEPGKLSTLEDQQQGAHKSQNLTPLFNPPPLYPLEARRRKVQGIVLVRLYLNERGAVDKVMPLSPRTDPALEDAALIAVRQWRFKPGVKTLEIPIEFKLTNQVRN